LRFSLAKPDKNILHKQQRLKVQMVTQDKLPLRISIFGQGCRVLVGKFDENIWERLNAEAARLNMPLTDSIFDPSFYNNLGDIHISSLSDLGNQINIHGLINSDHSVIEFQRYRKRKRVFIFNEIIASPTLFPLFNVNVRQYHVKEEPRTILVVEKEIGLVYGFKLDANDFSLEKIQFEVSEVLASHTEFNFEMISSISYKNVKLVSHESNALVNGQYAIT